MNATKETKIAYLKRKLLNKYRLVSIDMETFEEKASFKISRLNLIIYGVIFGLFFIILTSIFIIYSPFRQYLLGFSEIEMKKQTINLAFKVDSLENVLENNQKYLQSIKKVLVGDIFDPKTTNDSVVAIKNDAKIGSILPNKQDSILRQEVAEEDMFSFFPKASFADSETLFPPVMGVITKKFNPTERHYGVNITAPEGSSVKAAANGVVIFSQWTADEGFVLIIEHKKNLVSVYKNNATLVKQQGDQVRSGEVIATVGQKGNTNEGSHLHFELWNNGYPINPTDYVEF